MKRAWQAAAIYLVFLGVALAAMGWVSRRLLEYERAENESQKTAAVEENVRLALWRMETMLAPLIVGESARPVHEYNAFHGNTRVVTDQYTAVPGNMVLTPSPLLVEPISPWVKLYFQLDAGGAITSPEAPSGYEFGASVTNYFNGSTIEGANKRLDDLKGIVKQSDFAILPPLEDETHFNPPPGGTPPYAGSANAYVIAQGKSKEALDQRQEQRNREEMQARMKSFESANSAVTQQQNLITNNYANSGQQTAFQAPYAGNQIVEGRTPAEAGGGQPKAAPHVQSTLAPNAAPQAQQGVQQAAGWNSYPNQAASNFGQTTLPASPSFSGLLQPLWIHDELFLARRVRFEGTERVQAIWLDWGRIRAWLLGEVRDLLPNATLERIEPGAVAEHAHRLAALPVQLDPGEAPGLSAEPRSVILRPLVAAWVCLLLAAVAVGVLIVGLFSLGERRRSFVTAVSHELRTPLTTFSMYTDMLAGPLGEDAEKRGKYLRTLRAESRRLGHMVENILAYARLENTSRRSRIEEIDLAALVLRNADGLRERCERQAMTLTLRLAESGPFALANQTAVEQILFNLVDNACKYGHTDGDEEKGIAARREVIVETFGVTEDVDAGGDANIDASITSRGGAASGAARAGKNASKHSGAPGLRVSDRGPGIDSADLRALFTPFHKSAQKAAKTAPGVGLGLALSLRLAREMDGDLRLVKGETEGACFELVLKQPD